MGFKGKKNKNLEQMKVAGLRDVKLGKKNAYFGMILTLESGSIPDGVIGIFH